MGKRHNCMVERVCAIYLLLINMIILFAFSHAFGQIPTHEEEEDQEPSTFDLIQAKRAARRAGRDKENQDGGEPRSLTRYIFALCIFNKTYWYTSCDRPVEHGLASHGQPEAQGSSRYRSPVRLPLPQQEIHGHSQHRSPVQPPRHHSRPRAHEIEGSSHLRSPLQPPRHGEHKVQGSSRHHSPVPPRHHRQREPTPKTFRQLRDRGHSTSPRRLSPFQVTGNNYHHPDRQFRQLSRGKVHDRPFFFSTYCDRHYTDPERSQSRPRHVRSSPIRHNGLPFDDNAPNSPPPRDHGKRRTQYEK